MLSYRLQACTPDEITAPFLTETLAEKFFPWEAYRLEVNGVAGGHLIYSHAAQRGGFVWGAFNEWADADCAEGVIEWFLSRCG